MKSRIFQAILIIIVFAVGVVLFSANRSSDSGSSATEQPLDPSP